MRILSIKLLDAKPVIKLASVALVKIKLCCVLSKLHGRGLWRFNIKEANYWTARPFLSAS